MSAPHALNPTQNGTPDRSLLEEAADWLVARQSGDLSPAQRDALEVWRARSAEHERVWQAALTLDRTFETLPDAIARPVLERKRLTRRDVLGALAGLGVVGTGGWTAYRLLPWRAYTADYRTVVGNRSAHVLPDGSRLTLNTDTAVDIAFDATLRRLIVYRGEVLIETAADPSGRARPFLVDTPQGRTRALGTRFTLRIEGDTTAVGVIEHAVEIRPADRPTRRRVDAGQAIRFERDAIHAVTDLSSAPLAWTRGQLVADNQRLADFVVELGRYRRGVLRCDPRIADRRISGVFQLDDTDRVLAIVARTLDLTISATTGYWVVLEPAG